MRNPKNYSPLTTLPAYKSLSKQPKEGSVEEQALISKTQKKIEELAPSSSVSLSI